MNQHEPLPNDFVEADTLNRAWDAWQSSDAQREDTADFFVLFAELDAIDKDPTPDRTFLERLRADVVGTPITPTAVVRQRSSLGLVAANPLPIDYTRVTPLRLAVAAIAAVLLIAALLGGNRWLPGSGSAVMVASAMASPTTQEIATATTYPTPRTSSDASRDEFSGRMSAQLVIFPTASSVPGETQTLGVAETGVVRTPTIVYSRE